MSAQPTDTVKNILNVLRSRKGFSWWWDPIDAETQGEIISELNDAVSRADSTIEALKTCDELNKKESTYWFQEAGRLKQQLSDIEEREAAVCPEDVPFDEYIHALEKKLRALPS